MANRIRDININKPRRRLNRNIHYKNRFWPNMKHENKLTAECELKLLFVSIHLKKKHVLLWNFTLNLYSSRANMRWCCAWVFGGDPLRELTSSLSRWDVFKRSSFQSDPNVLLSSRHRSCCRWCVCVWGGGDCSARGGALLRTEKFWDALGVLDAAERSHFLPNSEPA